jgi:hypothetical protein
VGADFTVGVASTTRPGTGDTLDRGLAEWVNVYMAGTYQRSGGLPGDWAPGP